MWLTCKWVNVYGEPTGVGQVEGGSGRTDIVFSLECLGSEMRQRGPPVTLAESVAEETALLPGGADERIAWDALKG